MMYRFKTYGSAFVGHTRKTYEDWLKLSKQERFERIKKHICFEEKSEIEKGD